MYLLSKTSNRLPLGSKKFFIVLLGLLIVLAQQIFLPSIGVFFLSQWLIFIFIFLINFFEEKENFPIVLAFVLGLLVDFISSSFLGIFALSLFLTALAIRLAKQRLSAGSGLAFFIIFIFCSAFFWLFSHLLIYVFKII